MFFPQNVSLYPKSDRCEICQEPIDEDSGFFDVPIMGDFWDLCEHCNHLYKDVTGYFMMIHNIIASKSLVKKENVEKEKNE